MRTAALSYREYRDRRYFAALDGLRAVSILLVVVLHTNPTLWRRANGGLGVFIFFVISGYLITTLSLREEEKRGALSLRAFYIRRICRIFPLYYLVLAFYIVLVIGLDYHGHRGLLAGGLKYFLTYVNEFAPHLGSMPFAHSWSLGVEEKFYLVWPVLAFVLWRGSVVTRFAGAALLIFVPFVLEQLGALPFDVRPFGQIPILYAYSAILVGCLLAFGLHYEPTYRLLAWFASGVGAGVAFLSFVAAHAFAGEHTTIGFVYAFAVALMMVSVVAGETPWTRFLAQPAMVFVGVRSYGMYLVHVICISVAAVLVGHLPGVAIAAGRPVGAHAWPASVAVYVLAVAAAVAVAAALNVTVERPFVSVGRRLTRRLAGIEPIAPPRLADPEVEPEPRPPVAVPPEAAPSCGAGIRTPTS